MVWQFSPADLPVVSMFVVFFVLPPFPRFPVMCVYVDVRAPGSLGSPMIIRSKSVPAVEAATPVAHQLPPAAAD